MKYFSAELTRARSTTLWWLTLLALPLVVMTYTFSVLASPSATAQSVLMWQSMYLTGLAAPVVAMFAAVAEDREKKARSGGTHWRGLSQRRQRLARFVVVLLAVGLFHLLNFGGTWLAVTIGGRSGSSAILLTGVYAFVGSIGITGLAAALARRVNVVVTLVAALAWQVIGTLQFTVEGDAWWAWPMSWPVRLILPVVGIHQNSLPLEPGDPLLAEKPWLALGLCLALGVTGAAVAVLVPPRRWRTEKVSHRVSHTASPVTQVRTRGSNQASFLGSLRGLHIASFTSSVVTCIVGATLLLGLVASVYPTSYLHGVFTFVVLPVGAGVLPVMVWAAISGAWHIMIGENHRSPDALLVWLTSWVATLSFVSGVMGNGSPDEFRRFTLNVLVGTLLCLVALLLTIRFGTVTTLVATILWTIVSLTLGGDVLAQTPLWFVALPSWAETATTPTRLLTAAMASATGIISLWLLIRRKLLIQTELLHNQPTSKA